MEQTKETWGERFEQLCLSNKKIHDVSNQISLFIEKEISSAVQKERERMENEPMTKEHYDRITELAVQKERERIGNKLTTLPRVDVYDGGEAESEDGDYIRFSVLLSALNERDITD